MGVSNSPVVGRDGELSVFDGLLTGLAAGRGGLAWVEGEMGIGKSALVGEVVRRASRAGCMTLVGRGDEAGQAFPLRLVADCLHSSAAAGSPGEPSRLDLFDLDAADPVWATAERMLAAIDLLCAERPVVLVAEDLQWADEWSLGLWARLAGSTDQIPLLLVGTSRTVHDRVGLARLRLVVQDRDGATVDLQPLTADGVTGLARSLVGGVPGPRLGGVLARAGGIPLYVREFVDALLRDGLLRVESGVAELVAWAGSDGLPGSLVASIGHRQRFLSPEACRAVRMAALLGAEFSAGEWATVTGISPARLSEVTAEAVAAGVLRSGPRRLVFRHELIRQVLAEQAPVEWRLQMHRQMARDLATAGHDADVVAAHLLAVPTLDEWALEWLVRCSEAMMLSAPEVAVELLERAVPLLADGDPTWDVLAARLAEVRFQLGRDEAAGETAEAVLARTGDAETACRMRVLSIRAAGRQCWLDLALARAEAAVADVRMAARWRARALAFMATTLLLLGRAEQGHARALEALEVAEKYGDALGGGYARHVLYLVDPATQGFRLSEALAGLDDDLESQILRVLLLAKQLEDLADRGCWGEFDSLLARALITAEQVGANPATWIPQAAAGFHYVRGDWDEALRYLAAIPPQFLGKSVNFYPRAVAARIGLRREAPDLVDDQLRLADVFAKDAHAASAFDVIAWSEVLALKAEAVGDLDDALAWRKLVLDLPEPLFRPVVDEFPNLVRTALQAGDPDVATAAAAGCQRSAEATGKQFHVLLSRLCHAQIADDADGLVAVAEGLREYGALPLQAHAWEEAACRLARDRDDTVARTALTKAVRIYADIGATLDIKRADARLRAFGVRRGSRSLHRRATHGWESLTPTQRRIAGLVADGLSNPDIAAQLFISRNTVQTHVSAILTKLSMNSRMELILNRPRTADDSD